MSGPFRKSKSQLVLEQLEDRLNPAPVLLQNLALPGANSIWDFSRGPFNAAPVVFDVNGDGRDDVIVPGGDGNLYAYFFNPNTGQMNPTPLKYDLGGTGQIQVTPVISLLPGGIRGVFVGNSNGMVFGFNGATGALLPGWPQTVHTSLSINTSDSIYGAMATADLDRDGSPEILCSSFNHELTAFHADGSVMWRFNDDDTCFTGITVGDLNNDGNLEVIAGGDSTASQFYWQGGRVNCLSADGRREWLKRTDEVIWSSPVLADINGDGKLEVIVGTGYFVPGTGNTVFALDANGKDLPGWPYVTGPSAIDARPYSSPAVADLLGDGKLEVVIADGAAQLHAIKPDGTALWKVQAFTAQNLYTSPIIGDFDGSGKPSVLIAAAGNIRAFAGANGQNIYSNQDNQFHLTAAAIGHIRGNNSFQLAIIGNGGSVSLLSPSFLQVFDLDSTTLLPPWPQFRQDATGNVVTRPLSSVTPLINSLYQNVRNRPPTAGELQFEQAIFSRSGSLRDAVNTIIVNPETRGVQVDGFYQTFLNRLPDPGGRTVWVNFLGSGRTYAQAAVEFGASDEAFAKVGANKSSFVTLLYRTILKRTVDPSPAEVQGWVNFLNNGVSRLALAGFFAISTEATNRTVTNIYATYLPGGLNTPSADALAMAGFDLRRTKQEEQVLADILMSAGDYATTSVEGSYVRAVYQDMLQRTPGAAETANWIASFENKSQTMSSFATSITRSPEYLKILVQTYFKIYLKRTPSDAEVSPFVTQLLNGVKREQVIQTFLTSQEYFNLAGGTNLGFINKVFQDLLGRAPSAAELNSRLAQGNGVRTQLPQDSLFGGPQEYYQHTIDQWMFRLYRRLASTPVDSSRLIQTNVFGEQALVGLWSTGTLPGDLQATLLSRLEYQSIAFRKSFWQGDRWLDVPLI